MTIKKNLTNETSKPDLESLNDEELDQVNGGVDPLAFAGNLASAVGMGAKEFGSKIAGHMGEGISNEAQGKAERIEGYGNDLTEAAIKAGSGTPLGDWLLQNGGRTGGGDSS